LTNSSDIDGDTTATGYGPYMQKWPVNALNDDDTVNVYTGAETVGDATQTSGWFYNSTTGEFGALHDDATIDWVNW